MLHRLDLRFFEFGALMMSLQHKVLVPFGINLLFRDRRQLLTLVPMVSSDSTMLYNRLKLMESVSSLTLSTTGAITGECKPMLRTTTFQPRNGIQMKQLKLSIKHISQQ